jgi:hypothetical protein
VKPLRNLLCATLAATLLATTVAHAQQGPAPIAPLAPAAPPTAAPPAAPAAPATPGPSDEQKAAAIAKYSEGVELVRKLQWSEGLAAFEASYKIAPTPAALFNIGTCERALGRYVRSRDTLTRALAEDQARGGKLPEATVTEARGYIAEMDRVIAKISLVISPVGAAIAIDGRPLAPLPGTGPNGVPRVAAGVAPPGPGAAAPAPAFEVVLDPGAHVITLSRRGFADAVVNKSIGPGTSTTLELKLDQLPATMKVTSSEAGAIVKVNDSDVGPTPVEVLRPPGSYKVIVGKDGFIPYEAEVTIKAGEELKLDAAMVVDEPSVLERWWFWTGAAAVVAGGVVLTYALTRPEPTTPGYDGGSTGWVVTPSSVRF